MFIERRRSTNDGFQKRVLFSPKGFTRRLFDDMATHGVLSEDDLSDPDNAVTLTDRHRDSVRASQSSRVRIRVSSSPEGKGRRRSSSLQRYTEQSEPETTSFALIDSNSAGSLRRKRSPSPTPSMTSTSSTEEIIRPSRKKPSATKPSKEFREVVPVHVPEFKDTPVKPKPFREMSPSRKGDPVVITPRVKTIVPRNTKPEAKQSLASNSPRDGKKKVRFILGDDDGRNEHRPVSGVSRRLS
ncbi:hypothetical protein MGYG_06969 [Nannizzia gypsea CBS 118893]|uniref:Uncharacterized protein n=1 Tax=Arthroderma gypseum (strain ATCC MYA-4604 / CBS 118893) TaxID=535722 RepID=E4V1Q2_ARTGP|nr:hypothetical protein MGYG_06969 [Nannizzia gypsea CBS 118893]EFR03967.1 hypothetical protein MGYG_06969 [Nannizzia gypsea CBS 118893]